MRTTEKTLSGPALLVFGYPERALVTPAKRLIRAKRSTYAETLHL